MNYEIIIGKCLEAYADNHDGLMDEDLKKMLNANARHLTSKFDNRQSNNLNIRDSLGHLQQGAGLDFEFGQFAEASKPSSDPSWSGQELNETQNLNMQLNFPAPEATSNVSANYPIAESRTSQPFHSTTTKDYALLPAQGTYCATQDSGNSVSQPRTTTWHDDPNNFIQPYLQQHSAMQQQDCTSTQQPSLWSDVNMDPVMNNIFDFDVGNSI